MQLVMSDELSALQEKILDVLKTNGGWMSRSELSTAIGRPSRLLPYDISMIEALIGLGLVEQTEELSGVVRTIIKYKAK